MSISATIQNSQQAGALDAELSQLAHDMHRLHSLARCVDAATDRERFASVEHAVDKRLNQLASDFAAQDNSHALTYA